MKRYRALAAGVAIVAALGVVSAASAAPASAAKSPAAKAQLTKLKKSDAKFRAALPRARACPRAKKAVTKALRIRNVAMKKATRSTARRLRANNHRLIVARMRLAKVIGACAAAPSKAAPLVISPGAGNVVVSPAPGLPGAPGAPGVPGTPGAPGSASTVSVDLPVRPLLDGLPIDLSAVLTTGPLPQVIRLVPSTSLTDPVCTALGSACVGINPAALSSVITSLTNGVPLVGPLVSQVLGTLTGGNVASLFTVQRVSDTVVRIVPKGPLATVRALLGSLVSAPATTVAVLKTTV